MKRRAPERQGKVSLTHLLSIEKKIHPKRGGGPPRRVCRAHSHPLYLKQGGRLIFEVCVDRETITRENELFAPFFDDFYNLLLILADIFPDPQGS